MENEFLFRDSPPYPIEVKSSKGNYLISKDGRKYLDFMAGWCVGNAGWQRKEIVNTIKKFSGPTYVQPDFIYARWEELAKKLVSLMPASNYTCFKATGGTEAVEIALKTAKAHNKREKFIAFKDAYHGQSLTCLALVGIEDHEKNFGPFSKNFLRINTENWEETTNQAVGLIEKGDVCAFISEPIICNLGVIEPPKSFFQKVADACKKTSTVLISDEIATGFGRTGKMFGFEHYGIEPDIITCAKGLSSGYAPIGAVIAKKDVAEEMHFPFSNYSTFGWHPLAVEAALKNIEVIEKEKLVENSEKIGEYLKEKISGFSNVQGRGLCVGFEAQNSFRDDCQKDCLIIVSLCNRAMLFPSLNVTKKEVDNAVKIMQKHI